MTWIKLDDNAPRHPKIEGLSDRSFRWWIRGLCYASEFLTDGVLPLTFLRSVPKPVLSELAAAGLWLASPEKGACSEIHDYLVYQASREDVERERARNRQRRAGGRTGGTPKGSTGKNPRPENREQRTEHREDHDTSLREAFERFWLAYPRKVGKDAAWQSWQRRKPDAALVETILAAVTAQSASPQWQRDGGQFIPHPRTWLHQGRWQDEDTPGSVITHPFAAPARSLPPDYDSDGARALREMREDANRRRELAR